jgi:hypothetical protein
MGISNLKKVMMKLEGFSSCFVWMLNMFSYFEGRI